MASCILVKLSGEINLKSDYVKRQFTSALLHNVRQALKARQVGYERIEAGGGRFFIYAEEKECLKMLSFLYRVFGIHSIALAEAFEETSLQGISGRALDYAKNCMNKTDSFKVDARRTGKHEFSSLDIAIACSEAITENFGGRIDLSKPDKTIYVEVRQDRLFIYLGEAEGFDGLPSGVSGRLLMFFSGERNEVMAALMLVKRGCRIYFALKGHEAKAAKALNKLNELAFTDFRLENPSGIEKFIKTRELKGIIHPASSLDESLQAFSALKEFNLPVYTPLLLVPEELINSFEERFFKEGECN